MNKSSNYELLQLPDTHSRLGKQSTLDGKLTFSSSFGISGTFKGDLHGGIYLVLYPQGKVTATIQCEYVFIAGHFNGTVHASSGICLYSGAHVRGELYCQNIRIQDGVDFDGTCNLGDNEPHVDIFNVTRVDLRSRFSETLNQFMKSFQE